MQSCTWSSTGRISTGGSIRPVGRMTCSANTPPVCSISQLPGVAETAKVCGRMASHSLKRRGRFAGQATGEEAAVVLDSRAASRRVDHLEVEVGPLLEPLGFEQPAFG